MSLIHNQLRIDLVKTKTCVEFKKKNKMPDLASAMQKISHNQPFSVVQQTYYVLEAQQWRYKREEVNQSLTSWNSKLGKAIGKKVNLKKKKRKRESMINAIK